MDTKKIIFDAFCELLNARPLGHITVNDIIAKAGISKPTFYRYFYSKYEIAYKVIDSVMMPFITMTDDQKWTDVLKGTFENLEKNSRMVVNGFKNDEQLSLRSDCMNELIERAMKRMIENRGADLNDMDVLFSVRASVIVHATAMIGWVCDKNHEDYTVVIGRMIKTLPSNIAKYFNI